jgi:hypothetical protein
MKSILKLSLLGLMAVAVAGIPVMLRAQDAMATNNAAAPHRSKVPFHGNLKAVDTSAMTITVGSHTFQITSQTIIKKSGAPATLSDGVVGEPVSGQIQRTADGKFEAVSVNFGAKPKGAPATSNTKTNTP